MRTDHETAGFRDIGRPWISEKPRGRAFLNAAGLKDGEIREIRSRSLPPYFRQNRRIAATFRDIREIDPAQSDLLGAGWPPPLARTIPSGYDPSCARAPAREVPSAAATGIRAIRGRRAPGRRPHGPRRVRCAAPSGTPGAARDTYPLPSAIGRAPAAAALPLGFKGLPAPSRYKSRGLPILWPAPTAAVVANPVAAPRQRGSLPSPTDWIPCFCAGARAGLRTVQRTGRRGNGPFLRASTPPAPSRAAAGPALRLRAPGEPARAFQHACALRAAMGAPGGAVRTPAVLDSTPRASVRSGVFLRARKASSRDGAWVRGVGGRIAWRLRCEVPSRRKNSARRKNNRFAFYAITKDHI